MINYYLLTKPGIILGNLATFAAAFILGSHGSFDVLLFFSTLFGLGAVIASACVCNNYIDRDLDKKMARTKKRPLALQSISGKSALLFALILFLLGNGILYFFANATTMLIASFGFFVYVVLYSLWKSHTVFGTAIGSIAGAIPPVVGYYAASGQFDLGLMLLFLLLIFWQMPHFFSIALLHLDDYTRAKIPVLPVFHGVFRTKIHMMLYISLFILTTSGLSYFGFTGPLFFWTTLTISLGWLLLSIRGFSNSDTLSFGRQMFLYSLLVIGIICLTIPIDRFV